MKALTFTALLFSLLSIGACSYKLDDRVAPENLIPQDSFTSILYDVMILESYIKSQEANVDVYYKMLPEAMEPIFSKHNIDSSRYIESMNYYSGQLKILNEIYNSIQDSLMLSTPGLDN